MTVFIMWRWRCVSLFTHTFVHLFVLARLSSKQDLFILTMLKPGWRVNCQKRLFLINWYTYNNKLLDIDFKWDCILNHCLCWQRFLLLFWEFWLLKIVFICNLNLFYFFKFLETAYLKKKKFSFTNSCCLTCYMSWL